MSISITAVDTYVVHYGVCAWPYVTHAFRQSADSSGLCPIQLAWSYGLGIGSWCCRGAYIYMGYYMLTELVKTTTTTTTCT